MDTVEGDVSTPDAFDELDVGIMLHDPESGAILEVNATVEEMYGYSASELRAMNVEEFSADSSDYSQSEAKERILTAAEGKPVTFEWYAKRATGDLLWVEITLQRTTVDGEECVMATLRDITEEKERQRRLQILYRVLRHNLRNEMNVVRGYAAELEEALDCETHRRQAEIIEATADDVASLSDSVTELEQITSRSTTEQEVVHVGDVAEKVVADIREQYPDADISITDCASARANVDDGLKMALEHVIENAVRHTDQPTPTVDIAVTEVPADNQVQITISDDGPGIPDINVEVLDDETEITSLSHGEGLGLWITKWSIESLGGELLFETDERDGTVVTLTLPRHDPDTPSDADAPTD